MRELFIDVKGGLGYNVSLCRVLTEVKANFKDEYKFYVRSPYWDIFESCSAVDGVYKPEEIRDFIFDAKDRDAEIVEHRLYDMSDFIYKKLNYREAWLKLMNIDVSKLTADVPTDFLDKTLKVWPNLKNNFDTIKKEIGDNEFIIVQFCGGQSPLDAPRDGNWNNKPYDYQHEPLKRHIEIDTAQEFVDKFKKAHPNTKIIQYALPNEPQFEGCEHFVVPYLTYYLLAQDKRCKGFLAIDSSLQHLISGLTKGVVIWAHSLPENFGYACNKNIVQNCRRDDILYFTELGPSGAKVDYIESNELFDKVEETL